jgi:hypothetical protein
VAVHFQLNVESCPRSYRACWNKAPLLLLPSTSEKQAAATAIDQLARLVQGWASREREFPAIDRLHVGGSFGKKTALTGEFATMVGAPVICLAFAP